MTDTQDIQQATEATEYLAELLEQFIAQAITEGGNPDVQKMFDKLPVNDSLKQGAYAYYQTVAADVMDMIAYISRRDEETPTAVQEAYVWLYKVRHGDGELDEDGVMGFDHETPEEDILAQLSERQEFFRAQKKNGEMVSLENELPGFLKILSLDEGIELSVLEVASEKLTELLYEISSFYPQETHQNPELSIQEIGNNIINCLDAIHNDRQPDPEEQQYEALKHFKELFRAQKQYMSAQAIEVIEDALIQAAQPDGQKHYQILREALNLPWGEFSEVNQDFANVVEILENSHYGMSDAKETIADHVAVEQQNQKPSGKVLLLVGPPGVGKTSIAKSVAKARHCAFEKISLAGKKDAALLTGHSSTYVGSKSGQFIQALKRAKTNNPVILLDEVDKCSEEMMNVLLAILDPAQNHDFEDDFLGFGYDFSNVTFICTANNGYELPPYLRDRMEIVHLDGYVYSEKLHIAKNYIIPRQMDKHGLTAEQFAITRGALESVVRDYTKEAGVRQLEQKIAKLCTKAVRHFLLNPTPEGQKPKAFKITPKLVDKLLGVDHKISPERIPLKSQSGVMNALYYSAAGGGMSTFAALSYSITEKTSYTADKLSTEFNVVVHGAELGETLKASVDVAKSVILSDLKKFKIDPEQIINKQISIDLHQDPGSDGPSAGGVLTTMIISALTGQKIRKDVAMTGTIGHGGKIGAIGGLKQKLDGAVRAGVKTVIISEENINDLVSVPKDILNKLDIKPVKTIHDVLPIAFIPTQCVPQLG